MMRQVQEKLLQQSRREYQPKQRLFALAGEGILFIVIIPVAIARLGAGLDQWIGAPAILFQPVNTVLGVLAIVPAWLFAIWSIVVQFTTGRGTPVPLMATQQLIIQPPYSFCRNPMALGAIVAYLGIAILLGSIGSLILVLLGACLLLAYIKRFEEKEMEIRFGQEYMAYRRRTPFLFPRFIQRQ